MTNFERIKQMSEPQMLKFLGSITDCGFCPNFRYCHDNFVQATENACENALKNWLEQEVKQNDVGKSK